MDDPLPKTAQDNYSYTYRINNFHPSLDNIITISILKVRFEEKVYTVHCTVGVAQIFVFFAKGVTGSLYIREHCCKVSAKNIDRYPPANAILCLHLNNSTSKLRSNTWQYVALADALFEVKRLFPAILRQIEQISTIQRIFNTTIDYRISF